MGIAPKRPSVQPRKAVATTKTKAQRQWYVLRDLHRPNAKTRAYQMLRKHGLEVFVPMKWTQKTRNGKRVGVEAPALPDLLIVHATEARLDPYVTTQNLLQYRLLRGGWMKKMVVPDDEMMRFMSALNGASSVGYYSPEEYQESNIGKEVRIHGGAFDGESGELLNVSGTKNKRIVVRLSNLFVALIELKADGTVADEAEPAMDIESAMDVEQKEEETAGA